MKLHAVFEITPQQENYLRSAIARVGGEIEHGGLEISVEAEPAAPVPAAEVELVETPSEVIAEQAVEPQPEAASTDSEQPGAQAPADDSGAREETVGDNVIVPEE